MQMIVCNRMFDLHRVDMINGKLFEKALKLYIADGLL